MSFALAIHLRFFSGLIAVSDQPNLSAYAWYAAINMLVWAALAARLRLPRSVVEDLRASRWLLRLAIANVGSIAVVSTVAFFWRGYSFSRLTTALAWGLFSVSGTLVAVAARQWAVRGLQRSSRKTRIEPSLSSFALEVVEDRSCSFDYQIVKRVFDVIAASLLLLVCAPLLAMLYAYIALTSGTPALIAQDRIGRGGRCFRLFKLRTLPHEALERADREWSVETPSKAMSLLRRSGLDELPQLVNVLRGEMSLVGPRPERPFFAKRFAEEIPGYAARQRLRAGLTGWAQIHGLRGDTSITRRLEHDLHYLRNWSLGLDAWILLLTALAVTRDLLSDARRAPGPANERVV